MTNVLKNAVIKFSLGFGLEGDTPAMGGNEQWSGLIDFTKSLNNGILAGQANLAYLAERQIATGANDDVDLAGMLADALGDTLTMAKLKALLVLNRPRLTTDPVNTTDLTIGVGSNPFLGFLGGTLPTIGPIKPGGFLLIGADHLAGIGTVTAGTGDILRIANSAGATNNYVLGLIGAASS